MLRLLPMLWPALLWAAPPAVRVIGAADAGCPDAATVAKRLPDAEPPVAFQITFSRAGDARVALIERTDGPGRRALRSTAASCAPLADAVVFALTLAADPLADVPPPPPEVTSAPVEATTAVAPAAPSLPWGLTLTTGLAVGATPAAPALGVGLDRRGDRWAASLTLRGQWPATADLGAAAVDVRFFSGDLAGCWRPHHRVDLCGFTQAGVLLAQGVGFPENDAAQSPLLGLGARARARLWETPRWWVALTADGQGLLTQLELTYRGAVVWASERVHGHGGLEVAWRFL